MAKKQIFTFKTTKPTGRFAWVNKPSHEIKLNKQVVGAIEHESWNIRLMVMKTNIMEDGNPNCPWKWITLVKQSASLDEAKQFLNERIESLLTKYTIKCL